MRIRQTAANSLKQEDKSGNNRRSEQLRQARVVERGGARLLLRESLSAVSREQRRKTLGQVEDVGQGVCVCPASVCVGVRPGQKGHFSDIRTSCPITFLLFVVQGRRRSQGSLQGTVLIKQNMFPNVRSA